MYSSEVRTKAIKLRQEGYSLLDLSKTLGIAKSTASVWAGDIWLNDNARQMLKNKQMENYKNNILLSIIASKLKKEREITQIKTLATKRIEDLQTDVITKKLLCAFLFWAEGAKTLSAVKFINSDANMIKTYLKLLRESFEIKEEKLRAIMHLHEYHVESVMKDYWSCITRIPVNQFNKTYIKPHTGKRKRENYKGCISITYCDYKIATELKYLYNAYAALID